MRHDLPRPPSHSDAELRAAMPALGADTSAHDVRALAAWAGPDPEALALAARGAASVGVARWIDAYADEPVACLHELGGGPTVRRWRRSLSALPAPTHRHLLRLAGSPVGLALSAWVASSPEPGCLEAVRGLLPTGWATWRGDDRVAVPGLRCALLERWMDGDAGDRTFPLAYTRRRLASERPWTADDRRTLAQHLEDPTVAEGLLAEEVAKAAEALRRTPHAELPVGLLRGHLADASRGRRRTGQLRRSLGTALIELGAFREALAVLTDRSRASRVLRAHALLRRGREAAARRILRALGPGDGDPNWHLQWTLAALDSGGRRAEDELRARLGATSDPRHRGLLGSLFAEWADRRRDPGCLGRYDRAITDLRAAGDEMVTAYCEARHARALARTGRRDEAAEAATRAWTLAERLPAATTHDLATLACLEAGVAGRDMLEVSLRRAAASELPEVAGDAAAALGPGRHDPIIGLGRAHARLDGQPLALPPNGPPWRLLAHLCRLPPGSLVTVQELFDVGWPGERARPESVRKRVHTAVWTLRKAGLREALETVGRSRYRLRARVVRDAPGAG